MSEENKTTELVKGADTKFYRYCLFNANQTDKIKELVLSTTQLTVLEKAVNYEVENKKKYRLTLEEKALFDFPKKTDNAVIKNQQNIIKSWKSPQPIEIVKKEVSKYYELKDLLTSFNIKVIKHIDKLTDSEIDKIKTQFKASFDKIDEQIKINKDEADKRAKEAINEQAKNYLKGLKNLGFDVSLIEAPETFDDVIKKITAEGVDLSV